MDCGQGRVETGNGWLERILVQAAADGDGVVLALYDLVLGISYGENMLKWVCRVRFDGPDLG